MINPEPQRPLVGVILLLLQDDKLLLQLRSTKDELNLLHAPIAGKVDQFESPSQAVIREAYEEAGILIDPANMSLACTVHWSKRSYKDHFIDVIEFYYVATSYEGTPQVMEPDKALSVGFYNIDQLPDTIVASIPKVLEAIKLGKTMLEWRGDF